MYSTHLEFFFNTQKYFSNVKYIPEKRNYKCDFYITIAWINLYWYFEGLLPTATEVIIM